MISFVIEWCAHNRFLVFTAVALLVIGGIWSVQHVPLDALPDISDVQVIVHTSWMGQPPRHNRRSSHLSHRDQPAGSASCEGGSCTDDVRGLIRVRCLRRWH